MATSTQSSTTRGTHRADEFEFTGGAAVEGIYASNGSVVDVTGTSGVKLPTVAPPVAGYVVYATDTAGTLAYTAPAGVSTGGAAQHQVAIPAVFEVTGGMTPKEEFVGSVAVDETLLTGGTVLLTLSFSHQNESGNVSFDPVVHLRRLTASYADEAALVAAPSQASFAVPTGASAVYTVSSAAAAGAIATSTAAVYAVTVAVTNGAGGNRCQLRDFSVNVLRVV